MNDRKNTSDSAKDESGQSVTIRQPEATDGLPVHDLIAACPPLDRNSLYCNLLQCSDFGATCALAEKDGEVVGFVSGYIPPERPDTLFIWQVAVGEAGRGRGLAKALILDILKRPACGKVRYLDTTITDDNKASWAMFEGLARGLDAETTRLSCFDRDLHFGGKHASEIMLRIGPFITPAG